MKMAWKGVIRAYIQALYQHLHGGTEENHKNIRIVYVSAAKLLIPHTSPTHYCLKQLVCTSKVFTNLHGNKGSEMASYYRIHSYGK
jgi:hypothetical protein